MSLEIKIAVALGLDFLLGDPRFLPHPVKLIAAVAATSETFNRNKIRSAKIAGLLTCCIVLAATLGFVISLRLAAAVFHPAALAAVDIILLYFCLAAKDLAAHSKNVYDALVAGDISLARTRVAMIVGRDTERLNATDISRACVESVAENIVDGVTAPLFYAAIGGPVAALLYKAVNTMDSMFGYKNDRYLQFGRFAARLDDVANFIPARISGVIIVVAAFLLRLDYHNSFTILRRDRLRHASPNSGHTEAAMAGALRLALGGSNSYGGKMVENPVIGAHFAVPGPDHIIKANRVLYVTSVLAFLLFIGARLLLRP